MNAFYQIKTGLINIKRSIVFVLLITAACKQGYHPPWGNELLEDSTCQNLLQYSEDFHDESWFRNEARVVNNAALDPNKNLNADLLDISSNASESRIYQYIDSIPKGTYVFSLYLKSPSGMQGDFAIGLEFRSEKRIWNKTTVRLTDQEWTRATVKIHTEDTGRITVFPAYALIKGTTIDKVYAWGAQLELLKQRNEQAGEYCGKNVILGNASTKFRFIEE